MITKFWIKFVSKGIFSNTKTLQEVHKKKHFLISFRKYINYKLRHCLNPIEILLLWHITKLVIQASFYIYLHHFTSWSAFYDQYVTYTSLQSTFSPKFVCINYLITLPGQSLSLDHSKKELLDPCPYTQELQKQLRPQKWCPLLEVRFELPVRFPCWHVW